MNVNHGELLVGIVGLIITLIGGAWYLANAISDISRKIDVHAAAEGAESRQIRKDVDRHEEILDKHDDRIATLEQGKVMVAVLNALRNVEESDS